MIPAGQDGENAAAGAGGSRRRRLLPAPLALLLAAVLTVVAGAALHLRAVLERPGPLAAARTVVVPRGAGIAAIAGLLAREGVIAEPQLFRLAARVPPDARPLRAGEFAFAAGTSIAGAVRHLRGGDMVVRRITVPEGLTTPEVLALVAAAPGLAGDVPQVAGEGRLLPETYHYSWGDTRAHLVGRMRGAMADTVAELWPGRAGGLPFATPGEAVTLASIVEKETAVAAERPRVAAVFINRLARGMRLQSDPTAAFAAAGGAPLARPLRRTDLRRDHPYNTYVIRGLPPGPIASPGRASLEAVLHPAVTGELYFVADGSGGHAFAATLAEHNRNVARWRQVQRRRAAE